MNNPEAPELQSKPLEAMQMLGRMGFALLLDLHHYQHDLLFTKKCNLKTYWDNKLKEAGDPISVLYQNVQRKKRQALLQIDSEMNENNIQFFNHIKTSNGIPNFGHPSFKSLLSDYSIDDSECDIIIYIMQILAAQNSLFHVNSSKKDLDALVLPFAEVLNKKIAWNTVCLYLCFTKQNQDLRQCNIMTLNLN